MFLFSTLFCTQVYGQNDSLLIELLSDIKWEGMEDSTHSRIAQKVIKEVYFLDSSAYDAQYMLREKHSDLNEMYVDGEIVFESKNILVIEFHVELLEPESFSLLFHKKTGQMVNILDLFEDEASKTQFVKQVEAKFERIHQQRMAEITRYAEEAQKGEELKMFEELYARYQPCKPVLGDRQVTISGDRLKIKIVCLDERDFQGLMEGNIQVEFKLEAIEGLKL